MVNEQNKLNNIREISRKKILGADANVLLTTGGIDDFFFKYFVKTGCETLQQKKNDLKRILLNKAILVFFFNFIL